MLILSLIFGLLSHSAPVSAHLITLDTIIETRIPASSCFESRIAIAGNQNEALIYLPSPDDNDTIKFLQILLPGMHLDTLSVVIPGLTMRISSPLADEFTCDQHYIVLGFGRNLLIINRDSSKLSFHEFLPLAESITFAHVSNNKLIVGRCYDFNRLDAAQPTMLTIYDLDTRKFLQPLYPKFNNIELTHFSPFHNIDVYGNLIAFSQTTRYEIAIYDTSLKLLNILNRNVQNWSPFDTTVISLLHAKHLGAHGAIQELSGPEEAASRLESVDFLDSRTLLVRYIPAKGDIFPRTRRLDLWERDASSWKLVNQDFLDSRPIDTEILTKKYYPLESGYSNTQYVAAGDKLLISPRFSSATPKLGLRMKDMKRLENNYISKHDPILCIFIYSVEK